MISHISYNYIKIIPVYFSLIEDLLSPQFGKSTMQSSTFNTATSDKVVDGNTNGNYVQESCMRSGKFL